MKDAHERERLLLPEQLAGIDLNLIVAFDALARSGSVTAAARTVGVTQSAMSHSLRRLRELVSDPLFVRVGNAMVLTERARELVVPLRSGLTTLARALLMPADFDPRSARRTFSLATPDLFEVLAIPPLLARIGAQAQGIELKLRALDSQLSEQLATGELDLAIVPRFERTRHAPAEPAGTGLVRRTLLRDRFVCLLRVAHPALAKARRTLSLDSYLSLSHALVSPSGDPTGPVDEALARGGHKRRIGLSVPHFTSALEIVAKSDLVLTAPSGAALVARGRDIVALAAPLSLPEHSVDMVWHERFSHEAGHQWLRALLLQVARELQTGLGALLVHEKPKSRRRQRVPRGSS